MSKSAPRKAPKALVPKKAAKVPKIILKTGGRAGSTTASTSSAPPAAEIPDNSGSETESIAPSTPQQREKTPAKPPSFKERDNLIPDFDTPSSGPVFKHEITIDLIVTLDGVEKGSRSAVVDFGDAFHHGFIE